MDGTKKAQQLLTHILASAVCPSYQGTPPADSHSPECLADVYRLAKAHDLGHVVAQYVHEQKLAVSPKLENYLTQDALLSVFRCEQLKFALDEICQAFAGAQIPHIPLKGSVIRPYYPIESMRTSCDIDILVHEEDLPAAIAALEAKGYRCGERAYHDVSLYSPNQIHLELHFNIQENIDSLDKVLCNPWQYAVPLTDYRYGFQDAFFVFHMYAHMAYHFLSGGCGLKALMDIYIMENAMNATCHSAEALLKEAGIYTFASHMRELANRVFRGEPLEDFPEQLLQYVFAGGVYGSKENTIAVFRSRGKSNLRYTIERIFLPYRSMAIAYPILKKAPYLLPFFWVVRWTKALLEKKTGTLAKEIACVNNVSPEKVRKTKALCHRLGL